MIQNKAILIVDSENHTLRILKDLLIGNGFVVYFAPNCALAMQIAIKDLPDLILSEIVLEDMDGREFMKTVHNAPETSEIPFIFLTSRTLLSDKVSALDAGAEDYITKPFNETELLARVHVVLRRYNRRPVTALTEEDGIKGDLKDINLVDFVQLFDMGRKTATIEISGEDREGRIYFEGGELIHAVSGKRFGKEALYDLFAVREGSFIVHLNVSSRIRTIQEGSTNLMMEIMHRLDEQGIHPVVSGPEKRTPPERSSLHNEGIRELFEKGVIEEFTKG
ncbi:MAG: response regulator transcription factor [Deltaproteobacteria bacterium]|nr:response regulator transcription factor [Deltaproteobacteria bacterium]